ncbi:hypothetical protein CBR59_26945 [Bacillus thuringiensis]|uniref:hypothetical protein n=1 Tax=Bacillus cereus group TaxID=86661 RepID=UPI000C9DD467|nr:hypothetical protein [Bacillus thuringiensis]MCU4981624.1 hypothetical protein [Bacillus cereus]PNK24814.1 hypothetical protein CBP87_25625 [Bacillus thuringiensis]PNK49932.1 hypothetical protein CBR59_26945 [Bacillus thuringiensis]
MAITQRELKKEKDMVANLLRANGQDYNHWLHLHHQKYIEENQDLVMKALQAYKATPKEEKEGSKANDSSQLSNV